LKNTETLKKLDFSMRNMHLSQRRLVSCGGDPFKVSMLLINDIKFISDQLFSLWFKFINLLTLNPKFVTEFLRILYEEKMREYWGEHIYRTIVETEDFALPSEENVGEIHRQIAQQRRQSLVDEKQKNPNGAHSHLYDAFRIVELGVHAGLTSGPAGKAMLEEIEKSG
jgi:hypothetical protein